MGYWVVYVWGSRHWLPEGQLPTLHVYGDHGTAYRKGSRKASPREYTKEWAQWKVKDSAIPSIGTVEMSGPFTWQKLKTAIRNQKPRHYDMIYRKKTGKRSNPSRTSTLLDKIEKVERMRSSSAGNPRWKVIFGKHGSYPTYPNASVGYLLDTTWEGKNVVATIETTPSGRSSIIDIARANPCGAGRKKTRKNSSWKSRRSFRPGPDRPFRLIEYKDARGRFIPMFGVTKTRKSYGATWESDVNADEFDTLAEAKKAGAARARRQGLTGGKIVVTDPDKSPRKNPRGAGNLRNALGVPTFSVFAEREGGTKLYWSQKGRMKAFVTTPEFRKGWVPIVYTEKEVNNAVDELSGYIGISGIHTVGSSYGL